MVDTPAFLYEFGWQRAELGAIHGLDVPFVLDNLAAATCLTGPNPPQPIADEMHTAWIGFATNGDPGWSRYSEDRLVMTFGEPASELVGNPRAEKDAIRYPGRQD